MHLTYLINSFYEIEVSMNLEFYQIGMKDINLIKPLWVKLNQMHQAKSSHFSKWFSEHMFEERLKSLTEKASQGQIRIELVKDIDIDIGYCISSIFNGNKGEIDSIFIELIYRGHQIGDKLLGNALKWMENYNISSIEIMEYYGNKHVFPFYAKHGFRPKKYLLYKNSN